MSLGIVRVIFFPAQVKNTQQDKQTIVNPPVARQTQETLLVGAWAATVDALFKKITCWKNVPEGGSDLNT